MLRVLGGIGLLAVFLLLLAVLLLWVLPFAQAPQLWNLSPEESAAVAATQLEARAIVVQILGGVFLAGTLLFTLRGVLIAQEEIRVAREGQITERFTRATDQLGSDTLETRLGGIYALERIARNSPEDHWPVMEILAAYVRRRAPVPTPENLERHLGDDRYEPPIDIQAVLTVISRRHPALRKAEANAIDLHGTNLVKTRHPDCHLERAALFRASLQQAILPNAHLEGAILFEANLQEANLTDAHLEHADLTEARLEKAWLYRAHLKLAILSNAHLEGVTLAEAHAELAILTGAHLEHADLTDAYLQRAALQNAHLEGATLTAAHLEGAHLSGARLDGATLMGTHLRNADLFGAHLEGADLSRARGLTQAQIDETFMDDQTFLPEEPGPDGEPYRRSTRIAEGAQDS